MNTSKMELIKVWRKDDLRLTIYNAYKKCQYKGNTSVAYRFTQAGKLLFEGNDFHPSPLHADDSMETVYSLLSFLTLQEGDTDDEYFANYTKAQLAWIRSAKCENLSYFVSYMEEKQARNRH